MTSIRTVHPALLGIICLLAAATLQGQSRTYPMAKSGGNYM